MPSGREGRTNSRLCTEYASARLARIGRPISPWPLLESYWGALARGKLARANLALRTRRPHAHFPRPVIAPNGPMQRTFPAVLAISSYHLVLRGIPGDALPNIGDGAPAPVINTRARTAPSPWLTQLSLETGSSSVQGTRAAVTCIQPRPRFPKYTVSGGGAANVHAW